MTEQTTDSQQAVAQERLLKVRVSLKGRPLRALSFVQDVITVGRDPETDIHLDNPGVSRHHVRLEKKDEGYYAEDLGSANGTYLNDEPIQRVLLQNDDVLRIGKYSLWVCYEEDRRSRPDARAQQPVGNPRTTVLSTGDLEKMMAKMRQYDGGETVAPAVEKNAVDVALPSPSAPAPAPSAVVKIVVAFVAGAAVGAAATWLAVG